MNPTTVSPDLVEENASTDPKISIIRKLETPIRSTPQNHHEGEETEAEEDGAIEEHTTKITKSRILKLFITSHPKDLTKEVIEATIVAGTSETTSETEILAEAEAAEVVEVDYTPGHQQVTQLLVMKRAREKFSTSTMPSLR